MNSDANGLTALFEQYRNQERGYADMLTGLQDYFAAHPEHHAQAVTLMDQAQYETPLAVADFVRLRRMIHDTYPLENARELTLPAYDATVPRLTETRSTEATQTYIPESRQGGATETVTYLPIPKENKRPIFYPAVCCGVGLLVAVLGYWAYTPASEIIEASVIEPVTVEHPVTAPVTANLPAQLPATQLSVTQLPATQPRETPVTQLSVTITQPKAKPHSTVIQTLPEDADESFFIHKIHIALESDKLGGFEQADSASAWLALLAQHHKHSPHINELRTQIAAIHLERAESARKNRNWDLAQRHLDTALKVRLTNLDTLSQ